MSRLPKTLALFTTVFLDILSFGLVIPDVQLRAEDLTKQFSLGPWSFASSDPKTIGLLVGITLALYSLAQFLVAPTLGKLSDRLGRRPILVITCALAVAAALLYAFAYSLPVMWLSRIILGLAGANLGVAYAYASDISSAEERPKTMGLLGMAFGLGFMFGPPAGALLLKAGNNQPTLLGICSAGLALLNLLFVIFFLPEPDRLPAEQTLDRSRWAELKAAFGTPGLRSLLALFFVANFAFANLESTFYRVGELVYKVDYLATTMVLVCVGLVMAVTQGGLVRILAPKFGELNLLRAGYLFQAPTLASIPFVPWGLPVFLGASVLGLSNGVAQPSLSSLISKAAPRHMVGRVFGINQSLGALARIVSPIVANVLFGVSPWVPYVFAATLMVIPTCMTWFLAPSDPLLEPPKTPHSESQ